MKEGSEGDGSTSDSKDSETTTSSIVYSNNHNRHVTSHINHTNNIRSPLAISTTNGGSGGVGTVSPGQPLLRALAESTRNQAMGATLAAIGAEVAAAAAAAASSTSDNPALSPLGGPFASALLGVSKKNSTGRRSRAASSGNGGSSAGEETNGNGGLLPKGKPMSATPPPDQSSPSPGSVAGVPPGAPRDKVFVCGVCNRCFGYKHVLQNHERTHTGEKPFECKECHKRFTRDHHLKTHMRLHTGEKPYHCSHCERQFVQVANLRRHLRVHTGERPYACELCSSRFSDSNQLKAHMLIHKGEKPFECKKCLGRFRRRHHLMHHKCPKEELNLGKPRRGRRPKAYDSISPPPNRLGGGPLPHARHASATAAVTAFPTSVVVHEPPLAIRPGEMASLGSISGAKTNCSGSRSSTPGLGKALPGTAVMATVQQPPLAHSSSGVIEKNNRRKPAHTVRILTPQQRELFLRDKETMQTQAIDMSLSPTPDSAPLALLSRTGSATSRYGPSSTMEGVLDLSNSRSDDSEAEPIEEDIDDPEEEELLDEELYDEDDDELMDLESSGAGGGSEDDSRGAMTPIRAATLKAVRISAGTSTWEKATATVIHNHHHLHHRDDNNQSPHRLRARDNGDLA